jgi:hypothetical protein
MQISFSVDHPYTPEWRGNNELPEGERFTATLSTLTVGDLMVLLDGFTAAGVEGTTEVSDIGPDQIKPILSQAGSLLPKYVKLHNLNRSDDGSEVTIANVVEFPYFLNLSVELLMKLAEISTPQDDDVGNSNAPLDSEPSQ